MLRAELGPLGDVEPAKERPSVGIRERGEYDRRGFGIDEGVELGRGSRIARMVEGSAHDHEAPEQARQLGVALNRERHVRERARCDERDLPGPAAGGLDEQVGAEAGGQCASCSWELGISEPVGPWKIAVRRGATSGARLPSATSTSPAPASSSTASVFAAACGATTLPAQHVAATSSTFAEATA